MYEVKVKGKNGAYRLLGNKTEFNSLLMFSDDYDNNKIINLFRDKETINSTSSAFTDYVFNRISNFSDISVF